MPLPWAYANKNSVVTMMITNAVLGGIADTVAQTITAVRQRAVRKLGGVKNSDTFAIEIHELNEKNPLISRVDSGFQEASTAV